MATKYDIEAFCDDLGTFLKANLNTKLAAIDTDKNDSITLTQLSNDAYFFGTLGDEIANFNPFIVYGISEMRANEAYAATDSSVIIYIAVVLSDEGNDTEIIRKLLRYQRALKELLESNYAEVSKVGKIKVTSIAPFDMKLLNRAALDRAIGVELEVHVA